MAIKAKDKPTVTFRISPIAKFQVEQLVELMGLTQAGVIETAIRDLAKKHKIPVGGSFTPQEGEKKEQGNE